MKRFIAGAQCPQCKNTDTLFVEAKTGNNEVQCTRCDYHDVRSTSISHTEAEEDKSKEDKQEKSVIWH